MHQQKMPVRGSYAVPGDFCRVFIEEMNRLYLLSFLLTGDHAKAGQCFVSGFNDCVASSHVFRGWAVSWARRTIVQNAIRIVQPSKTKPSRGHSGVGTTANNENDAPFAAVLALNAFERFVFVLSVLERYSDQECRILLACSRHEVAQARVRALQQVAGLAHPVPPAALPEGNALAQAV